MCKERETYLVPGILTLKYLTNSWRERVCIVTLNSWFTHHPRESIVFALPSLSGFLIPSDRTITADVVSESADYCRCVVSRHTQASRALLSPQPTQVVWSRPFHIQPPWMSSGAIGTPVEEFTRSLALIKAEPDISRGNWWFGRRGDCGTTVS